MSTTKVVLGPQAFMRSLLDRVGSSDQFVFVFAVALFGGAVLTLLAGLVGLAAWISVVITLVVVGAVNLVGVGWIFAATALFLGIFDLPFGAIVVDGGGSDEEQNAFRLILILSLVCLVVTGFGAYLILTGNPWALMAALAVPIINLVLFVWAWIQGIRV